MSEISDDLDVARKTAEEGYCDCFGSLANCAQELTEETTTIPQALRNYIDYESMARDIELTGYLFTIEGGAGRIHVFWNRWPPPEPSPVTPGRGLVSPPVDTYSYFTSLGIS